jgi:hypothetical protein
MQGRWINSKIDIVIPLSKKINRIKDFVKNTKNVGELINIINSHRLYGCSYILSILPIQSNE